MLINSASICSYKKSHETVLHHQLLFVRHAETIYSNIYPDITEEGADQLRKTAEELRPAIFAHPETTLTIVTSPAMRARGSASVLAETLGYRGEIAIEPLLSDMSYPDWPKARQIFEECRLNGGRVEHVYDTDDRFEDGTIFEPRSSVRKRFYQHMQQCHERLQDTADPQCILMVSHFEVLNHFLRDLWPDSPWLQWATSFRITYERPRPNAELIATVSYAGRSLKISPETLGKPPSALETPLISPR